MVQRLAGLGDQWYSSRAFLSFIVLLPILSMCFFPKLGSLAILSGFAVISVCYATILFMYQFAENVSEHAVPIYNLFDCHYTAIGSIATIGMSFTSHVSVLLILGELRHATVKRRRRMIVIANSVTTVIYVLFCLFAYLCYGISTSDDVLSNTPLTPLWVTGRIAIVFLLAFSYPVLMVPGRAALDDLLRPLLEHVRQQGHIDSSMIKSISFVLETVAISGAAFGLSLAMRSIGAILALFGSISGSFVLYVFPGLLFLRLDGAPRTWRIGFVWLLVVFGMLLFIGGTTVYVIEFI